MLGPWVGTALLALGLAACSPSPQEAESVAYGPDNGITAEGTSALAANLAQAPWNVEYHGIRRLEFLTEQPVVSYKERVSADGNGAFGIRVIDVVSSSMDSTSFIAKQSQEESFNYRYRGFRVLDPFLFETNYTVQLLHQEQPIAGVNCTRLLVRKRVPAGTPIGNHFLVDMEPTTGLVLGWQELSPEGVLQSKMVFESFGFGPAADPIPMGTGSLTETELDPTKIDRTRFSFEILRPRLLPSEHRLVRAYEVTDAAGQIWLRQVFTDGEGALIFMHRSDGLVTAGGMEAGTLGCYAEGQWTVVMGEINGYSLLAVGKMGSNEIQDFVASCF